MNLVSKLAKGRSLAATDLSSERLTRKHWNENFDKHANGLVQDCGISIANVPEIPQSCTGPLISANEFHHKI